MTADRAGTLFAGAATSSPESARNVQMQIRRGVSSADFCPDIEGLPEGLTGDEFQTQYGGLGGAMTEEILQEIRNRLATCKGLTQRD